MSLLNSISQMEEAIRKNPTPELVEAFEKLTGKRLELKEAKESVIETRTETADLPRLKNKSLDNDDDFEKELDQRLERPRRKKKKKSSFNTEGREASRVPFSPPKKINFWDDKNEGAEDRKFDKEHPIPRATPRNREKAYKVKVTCRKCHKRERVSPSLVRNSKYVCNQCACSGN